MLVVAVLYVYLIRTLNPTQTLNKCSDLGLVFLSPLGGPLCGGGVMEETTRVAIELSMKVPPHLGARAGLGLNWLGCEGHPKGQVYLGGI